METDFVFLAKIYREKERKENPAMAAFYLFQDQFLGSAATAAGATDTTPSGSANFIPATAEAEGKRLRSRVPGDSSAGTSSFQGKRSVRHKR
jgi:hypothetical protein